MTTKKIKSKWNLLFPIGTTISQGIDASLIPICYLISALLIQKINFPISFSVSVLAIKESLTFFLIFVYSGGRIFKEIKKIQQYKHGYIFFISGLLGAGLGNIVYLLAIVLSGIGYGVMLTCLYPIFSVVLTKWFGDKTKQPFLVWLGVFITVLSAFLFVSAPSIFNTRGDHGIRFYLGIFFGLLAGLLWAIEGLILHIGINKIPHASHISIVYMRSISSFIFTVFIAFPITLIINMKSNNMFTDDLKPMITNYESILTLLFLSINQFWLRILHTKSINLVGPRITSIIDSNNYVIPPIIASIFSLLPILNSVFINETINPYFFLIIIPIFIGVFITVVFHKEDEKYIYFDDK